MDKIIVEWTYVLQIELEQMTEEEFAKYMQDKVIKLDGKLYGLNKEIQ